MVFTYVCLSQLVFTCVFTSLKLYAHTSLKWDLRMSNVDKLWGEYNEECAPGMKDMADVAQLVFT